MSYMGLRPSEKEVAQVVVAPSEDSTNRLRPPCIVYSFGSSNDAQFEREIIRQTNCSVHIFDPTSGAIEGFTLDDWEGENDVLRFVRSLWRLTKALGLGEINPIRSPVLTSFCCVCRFPTTSLIKPSLLISH
jgi:hypothetical protein